MMIEQDIILLEIREVLNSIKGNEKEFIELLSQPKVRILCYGAGRMGFGLKAFCMRLNHLGIQASFFGDNYIPPLRDNDILIVCSNSGETKSVLSIVNIVKDKIPGVKIISIVGNKKSSMAKLANLIFTFKSCNGGLNSKDSDDKIDSIQPMTTVVEQAMFIYFDYVVLQLMKKNGINLEETKLYHSNIE